MSMEEVLKRMHFNRLSHHAAQVEEDFTVRWNHSVRDKSPENGRGLEIRSMIAFCFDVKDESGLVRKERIPCTVIQSYMMKV